MVISNGQKYICSEENVTTLDFSGVFPVVNKC